MARLGYVKLAPPTYYQGLLDLIDTELVAHGGYELVDTVNSPGGMPCKVYRCKASASTTGKEWYLLAARTIVNPSSANSVYVAIAEGYNPTTKKVARPAPGTAGATVVPAVDYSYGGGTEYSIWLTVNNLNVADIGWIALNGYNQNDCWLVTANAGLWFWSSNQRQSQEGSSFFAGPVEKLDPTNLDIYVVGDHLWPSLSAMRATRHPSITAAQPLNWQWMTPGHPNAPWTPFSGQLNGPGDRFWNGRPIGGRRAFRTGSYPISSYGDLYGLYPGLLAIGTYGQGSTSESVAPGDTTQVPRLDGSGLSDSYVYMFRITAGVNVPLWVDVSQP